MHTSHQSTGAAKVEMSHWNDSYLRCCMCTLVVSRSSRSSGVIRMIHHFLLIARLPPSLFSIRGSATRFSTVSPWWEKLWMASIWEEVKTWTGRFSNGRAIPIDICKSRFNLPLLLSCSVSFMTKENICDQKGCSFLLCKNFSTLPTYKSYIDIC